MATSQSPLAPAAKLARVSEKSGVGASTTPFNTNTSTSPATTTYNGDMDVNYLQTPNGQKIQLNVPGARFLLPAGLQVMYSPH
jgi:flagellar hook-associated protein 3 FlgL